MCVCVCFPVLFLPVISFHYKGKGKKVLFFNFSSDTEFPVLEKSDLPLTQKERLEVLQRESIGRNGCIILRFAADSSIRMVSLFARVS